MEVLIEKKEGIEDKNERCKQMGLRLKHLRLDWRKRLESSSSSDIFLTSEMTGHEEEEQSHSSSESSSPPSLSWPIQKAEGTRLRYTTTKCIFSDEKIRH